MRRLLIISILLFHTSLYGFAQISMTRFMDKIAVGEPIEKGQYSSRNDTPVLGYLSIIKKQLGALFYITILIHNDKLVLICAGICIAAKTYVYLLI